MDEAAHRTRGGEPAPTPTHPPAPSNHRIHEEQRHEEAERLAVEGDDLREIFESVLGKERPHVGEPPPGGVSWPPPLGRPSPPADGNPDARTDDPDDDTSENTCD